MSPGFASTVVSPLRGALPRGGQALRFRAEAEGLGYGGEQCIPQRRFPAIVPTTGCRVAFPIARADHSPLTPTYAEGRSAGRPSAPLPHPGGGGGGGGGAGRPGHAPAHG